MKKRITGFLGSAAAIVALALIAAPASAGEIKIGAGAAPTENVLKPVREHFEAATGIKMQIISSGPRIALEDLLRGTVDAAGAGLAFDDWMAMMKKENVEVKDPAALQQFIIGKDRIVVLLHKDNPIAKLSKDQLKAVFTGKVSNWKEVGGQDMPVLVIWGSLIPGTNRMFTRHILDGEAPTPDVLEATTADDVKQNVVANPEAIGIGPVAIVDDSVNSPETPEVARPITLVTNGKPSPDVQKLLDFIAGEGKQYTVQ